MLASGPGLQGKKIRWVATGPAMLGNTPLLVLTAGNSVSPEWVGAEARRQGRDLATELALARLRRAHQKALARLSSNSRHVVLEGSGHFIMYDKPDELVVLVREFLETLPIPKVEARQVAGDQVSRRARW